MNAIQLQQFNLGIASCDERIASIQTRLDRWKPYGIVMRLVAGLRQTEEDKAFFNDAPQMDNVKTFENNLKLVKIEKMIYLALINPSSKEEISKSFLAKYDELICVSYDISGNMVQNGIEMEGEYLDYYKTSLDQREFIRKICCVGYKGYLQ